MEKKALPDGSVLAFFKHPTAAGHKAKGGWMGDVPGRWEPSSEEAVVDVAAVEVAVVATVEPTKVAVAVRSPLPFPPPRRSARRRCSSVPASTVQ